ncbi:hypothetical protein [Thiohalomonas denitrificans]|uniref:hypothetical protein n=1 Tax=Thiohalomonas denitrificans TaxID=415747 RepID=UPI0026EC587D|nr:hypothetical protein [Thiohalomonas denitrificans]
MNNKTWISALAIGVVLSTSLVLPATASAREMGKETSAKVVKIAGRHGDMDRGQVERRKVDSRWAPLRHTSKHRSKHNKRDNDYRSHHRKHRQEGRDHRQVKQHRGYGHTKGHHKHRYERRDYRPVKQHRDYRHRRDDGVRVHIDYDFRL